MAIAPWPCSGDATEDSIRGSLVSREAFSTVSRGHGLRDQCTRDHRSPSTLSRSAERPSANGDTSAIRMGPVSVQKKIYLKRWLAKTLESKEDVDGRNTRGHDDVAGCFANLLFCRRPSISGLPEIGTLTAQVGQGRLACGGRSSTNFEHTSDLCWMHRLRGARQHGHSDILDRIAATLADADRQPLDPLLSVGLGDFELDDVVSRKIRVGPVDRHIGRNSIARQCLRLSPGTSRS